MHAWWAKLRPGGLLSGDDYGDVRDTPYLAAERWRTATGFFSRSSDYDWEVVSTMQAFAGKTMGTAKTIRQTSQLLY